MNDIVPTNELSLVEYVRKYESVLSAKQIAAIPYLSLGATIVSVSQSIGVPESELRAWMTDGVFRQALSDSGHLVKEWQEQKLQELSLSAFQKIQGLLDLPLDTDNRALMKEQMSAAKFIVDQLGLKTSRSEVKHEIQSDHTMHIDEGSADIVARRLHEIQERKRRLEVNTVDAEFSVLDLNRDTAIHPEATYGLLEYNEETMKFRCHVCNKWVHQLADHARISHGLSPNQYRKNFNIGADEKFDYPPNKEWIELDDD